MVEQLSEAERADALDGLPDWDYDDARDAITRSIVRAHGGEISAHSAEGVTRFAITLPHHSGASVPDETSAPSMK